MIRTLSFTTASDNKSPLVVVQLDRDEIHYKQPSREELLNYMQAIMNRLVEMG